MHKLFENFFNLDPNCIRQESDGVVKTYVVENHGKLYYNTLKDNFSIKKFNHPLINDYKEMAITSYTDFANYFNSNLMSVHKFKSRYIKNYHRNEKLSIYPDIIHDEIDFLYNSKNDISMIYKLTFCFKKEHGKQEKISIGYSFKDYNSSPDKIIVDASLISKNTMYGYEDVLGIKSEIDYIDNNQILVAYLIEYYYNDIIDSFETLDIFLADFRNNLEVLLMQIT